MTNTSTTTARSGGISIAGLLGVAFVVLKLTGHIDWSWAWVLAPFWIPIAVVLLALLIALFFLGLAKAVGRNR